MAWIDTQGRGSGPLQIGGNGLWLSGQDGKIAFTKLRINNDSDQIESAQIGNIMVKLSDDPNYYEAVNYGWLAENYPITGLADEHAVNKSVFDNTIDKINTQLVKLDLGNATSQLSIRFSNLTGVLLIHEELLKQHTALLETINAETLRYLFEHGAVFYGGNAGGWDE